MKLFLPQWTIDKTSIVSGRNSKEFLERIDEDKLPEALGGKCKHPLNDHVGPFKE